MWVLFSTKMLVPSIGYSSIRKLSFNGSKILNRKKLRFFLNFELTKFDRHKVPKLIYVRMIKDAYDLFVYNLKR